MKKTSFCKGFFIFGGVFLLGMLGGCVKNSCIDSSLALSRDIPSKNSGKPTLVYVMPPSNFLGDTEVMTRLVLTAKEMGWNTFLYDEIEQKPVKNRGDFFGIYIPLKYNYAHLDDGSEKKLSIPNVPLFAIDWLIPSNMITEPEKCAAFLERASNLGVEGVLGTSNKMIDGAVKKRCMAGNIKFLMTWYPTVAATSYQPNPVNLMYCGDKYFENIRSESDKYKALWKALDETGYFFVYGTKHAWENLTSYQGRLPADGKSFVHAINEHGIYLVLHDEKHLKEGVPSGRIFEGAAASAVIICDNHPFIKREFKDSVLYIDETRDDLFEQIEAHMRWIKENPEKAKFKAANAHSIFLEKFTFEEQLSRFYKYFRIVQNNLNKHER